MHINRAFKYHCSEERCSYLAVLSPPLTWPVDVHSTYMYIPWLRLNLTFAGPAPGPIPLGPAAPTVSARTPLRLGQHRLSVRIGDSGNCHVTVGVIPYQVDLAPAPASLLWLYHLFPRRTRVCCVNKPKPQSWPPLVTPLIRLPRKRFSW